MKRCFLAVLAIIVSITTPIFATFDDIIISEGHAKGFAITADSLGLESAYKNPAGIHSIQSLTFSTSYTSLFNDTIKSAAIGVGFPLHKNIKASINLPATLIDDNLRTVNNNGSAQIIESFSNHEVAAIGSIATSIKRLHIGVSSIYYHKKIDDQTAAGIGLDAGAILDLGRLTLGVAAQDIGGTLIRWTTHKEDHVDPSYHAGFTLKLPILGRFASDMTFYNNKSNQINIGLDKSLSRHLKLMAGINDIENSQHWRCGVRLNLRHTSLIYAYSEHDILGSSHKLSLQYKL